jgi:hypothetical protein
MEELLKKANIDDARFKREVPKIVAYNFSQLVEPCFYPELKKNFYEFLRYSGLTEKDVKDFTKRRWKGTKWASFQTHSQPLANFYIFLMQYFIKKRDVKTYHYLMYFYIIRHYASLMKIHFKYCVPETFKYALETLTKTHLFAREKTIPNALMYIAREMIRRFTKGLTENNLDAIAYFMVDSRNRVSQSMKSFSANYHNSAAKGLGLGTDELPSDDEDTIADVKTKEDGERLIDQIIRKIVSYRHVDNKAFEEAKKLSKINASLASMILQKINNTKYMDNIRIILKLFIKDLKGKQSLCGNDFNTYVRNLMSIKRTKLKIFFKQQVNIMLLEILKELRYSNKYSKMTSQTQFSVNLFLAYYLTMILKNTVC